MATWRIIVQKIWFNLAGSFAVSSFKEILSNLRKFYLRFKEMCEIGSESPDSAPVWNFFLTSYQPVTDELPTNYH